MNSEKLYTWYKIRLQSNPNSRNADLWKSEIAELEKQISFSTAKKLDCENSFETDDQDIQTFLSENFKDEADHEIKTNKNRSIKIPLDNKLNTIIESLWNKSKDSSADSLIKNLKKSKQMNKRKENWNPYVHDPLLAMTDSENLLQKLLYDVNVIGGQYDVFRDLDEFKTNPDYISEIKDPTLFLIGLISENVKLRLQLNKQQANVVKKTQEKAKRFEQELLEQQKIENEKEQDLKKGTISPHPVKSAWSILLGE